MENKLALAEYISNQIQETDMINLNTDAYESFILRFLVEFEEGQNLSEYKVEKKMKELNDASLGADE